MKGSRNRHRSPQTLETPKPEVHPPKVRKRQQGNPTCKPSRQHCNWKTLTQGAKPQPPQQASGAGEAQKNPMYLQQGKQRTGTEEKVAASPLQPHQRVDQQTGDRHANPPCKGAETLRGSSGRGSCTGTKKKTRGEQYNCDKTTPNPMRNHHRRSRAANLSQPAGCPRRAASCMTPSVKTAGAPRQAEQTHQGGSARADVTPSRRRKKIQHRCYRNKILPKQKQQGPPEKVGCSPDPQG